MAKYLANDGAVEVSYEIYYAGTRSECRRCGTYHLAEKFIESEKPSTARELIESLRILLYIGRPICPNCQADLAAEKKIILIRDPPYQQ